MTYGPNDSQPIDFMPIDVENVRSVLEEVDRVLDQVDGVKFIDDAGKKNAHHAAISRELLLAADRLDLAASLVRVQYWRTRGVADPLDTLTDRSPL